MKRPLLFTANALASVLLSTSVASAGTAELVIPQPDALMAAALAPGAVSQAEMQRVYEEVKTPHKYGLVLFSGDKEAYIDCASIFRHGGRWYMIYVMCTNKVGYETWLADSEDLLRWTPRGKILPFSGAGWDCWQADGGVALVDHQWGGTNQLGTFQDRYWMSYFGGSKQGYETDPLSIGMAWTLDPTSPTPWVRHPHNPVMTPGAVNARPFENKTLYKSYILHDKDETLGYPFVMFYNAKQEGAWIERIGMAYSRDLVHWVRPANEGPVIDNLKGISGDPQVVRMGDLWVMFYFGAGWKKGAFDTFAVSRDLKHWTKWEGEHLIKASEPYDKVFAHKPWIIKHEGVVYHFYCAVSKQGRGLALATSVPLGQSPITLPPLPPAPPASDKK